MTDSLCPYCRTAISGDTEERVVCDGCETPHHRDCYEENGGCTVFGCRCAPPEEPKVHVGAPEVQAIHAAPTVSAAQPVRYVWPASYSPLGLATISREAPAQVMAPAPVEAAAGKSKIKFVLLGVFLGPLGAHNFYAGFKKKALIQLAITVLTLGYGAPMSWLWAVIDVCTVETDKRGTQFQS